MNIRIRLATMNSAPTLPAQIMANQPSRCHSGFFGLLNVAQGMFTGHCCDLLAIDGAVADANAGA